MVLRTRLRCAPRILGPLRLVRRDSRVSGIQRGAGGCSGGNWLSGAGGYGLCIGLGWVGLVVLVLISFLVSCLFSFCVSCAPELPSLASYLRESLVSPLVLSLCYPFHRCRAYGDGAPFHCSASSASASSVHVCARLRAPSLPSVDLVILAVVCRAFRPSSVTCRYVARRHFPVCVVGSLLCA